MLLEGFELKGKGKTSAALKHLQKAASLKYSPEYVQHAITEAKQALRAKRARYRKKFFIPALIILVLAAGLLVAAYTVVLSSDLFLVSIILLAAAFCLAMIGLATSFLIKNAEASGNRIPPETEGV
jgi:hypothetical protein